MNIKRSTAAGFVCLLLGLPAGAATWNAGNGDYSLATNWMPVSVPCFEIVPVASTAVIDIAGVTVTQDLPLCTVEALTLAAGVAMNLPPGTQYTATGNAEIAGTLDGNGGNLIASGTTFGPGPARLLASLGSRLELDAASLDATAIPPGQIDLLAADGAASQIVLAALTDIDAGFNSSNGSVQAHVIDASDGGEIDLSALADVQIPVDREDRLTVRVRGTGTVLLDSLANSAGGGQLYFDVADGASVDLPALSALTNGRFFVAGGGQLTASTSTWTLNSTSLFNNNFALVSAIDAGTLLDLSGLSVIDAGFNSSNGSVQSHSIDVGSGADVALSGLTNVALPLDREDRLAFQVEAPATSTSAPSALRRATARSFFPSSMARRSARPRSARLQAVVFSPRRAGSSSRMHPTGH